MYFFRFKKRFPNPISVICVLRLSLRNLELFVICEFIQERDHIGVINAVLNSVTSQTKRSISNPAMDLRLQSYISAKVVNIISLKSKI